MAKTYAAMSEGHHHQEQKLTTMIKRNSLSRSWNHWIDQYAKSKGLGLIPAISPGHIDAMLVAMEKLGIKDPQANFDKVSKTAMDLETKRRWTLSKPSSAKVHGLYRQTKIFNMVQTNILWCYQCARLVLPPNGMDSIAVCWSITPLPPWPRKRPSIWLANDGFSTTDKDDVEFDKDVIISYWSKGWVGLQPCISSVPGNKGYKFT